MRALVYRGPGRKAWEEVPDPEISDHGDIIVRVDATAICGTDLHILKGDVVGAGPVGLSAITSARLFSPSHIVAIDLSETRLEAARHFGADVTVNNSREDALGVIKELTGRMGADVSIEAVGTPATFEVAGQIDAKRFITHRFGLDESETAYDVFEHSADTGALKVVLSR
jgi:alcohol dehydrogenase